MVRARRNVVRQAAGGRGARSLVIGAPQAKRCISGIFSSIERVGTEPANIMSTTGGDSLPSDIAGVDPATGSEGAQPLPLPLGLGTFLLPPILGISP